MRAEDDEAGSYYEVSLTIEIEAASPAAAAETFWQIIAVDRLRDLIFDVTDRITEQVTTVALALAPAPPTETAHPNQHSESGAVGDGEHDRRDPRGR